MQLRPGIKNRELDRSSNPKQRKFEQEADYIRNKDEQQQYNSS